MGGVVTPYAPDLLFFLLVQALHKFPLLALSQSRHSHMSPSSNTLTPLASGSGYYVEVSVPYPQRLSRRGHLVTTDFVPSALRVVRH